MRSRGGFTLMELVVALGVTSVLVTAMGSAILLATRALPRQGDQTTTTLEAADALERIASELRYARSIDTMQPQSVRFSVPDRDGDSLNEWITYSLDADDPTRLLRSYNDGDPVEMLGGVGSFSLSYAVREQPGDGEDEEGGVLFEHTDVGQASYAQLNIFRWASQHFEPELPAGATHWRPTKVRFVMKRGGGGSYAGGLALELRTPLSGGQPSNTVLLSLAGSTDGLPSDYGWVEASLDGAPMLTAGQGVCVVLYGLDYGESARLLFDSDSGSVGESSYWISTFLGWSWTKQSDACALIRVYGEALANGQVISGEAGGQHLEMIRVDLDSSGGAWPALSTVVGLLGKPEVVVGGQ